MVGSARTRPGTPAGEIARAVGRIAVDQGYRVQSGGLGSLPSLILEGTKESEKRTDADTIAIIPGFDPTLGIGDIVIPTGLDVVRNALVANADVVVAIGGGAGTLSEIAFAWQLNRPILAWSGDGWSAQLAGRPLDARRSDVIHGFETAEDFDLLLTTVEHRARHERINLDLQEGGSGPS